MKKIIPLLVFCACCSFSSAAQSREAAVISAAGANMKAADIEIDWSIGEVAVAAYQNPKSRQSLLEGFQRSYLSIIKSDKIAASLDALQVYPNPFQSTVTVALPEPSPNVRLEVFSMDGRNLMSQKMTPESGLLKINLSDLPVGSYLLSFLNTSTGERKSQLILKSE